MKCSTLFFAMFLLITGVAIGQDSPPRKERSKMERKERKEMREAIESRKIAMITTELDLSSDEAKEFWPIYNDYQSKLEALRDENQVPKKDWEFVTDAEAEEMLDNRLAYEAKELELRKKYLNQMKGVVSAKKVAKLLHVERKFKERMLRTIRGKMKNRDDRRS